MDNSDAQLLAACRRGNTQAWEQLLDKYERLVFSIPLSYGLSREDAADVTQLTFTFFLESLDTLHDDSNLHGWLSTVARRQTWRVVAQHKREQPLAYQDFEPVADESTISLTEKGELVEWVHQGLFLLDERCRELLILLYFSREKTSYQQVSQQFGIPVGSVGPTRGRCLTKLRKLLEE